MSFVRNLLGEQRKRAIGTVMRHLESKVYPKLTRAEQDDLRLKVIAAIGQYHDTCLDILKSAVADGSIVNEEALVILARLEGKVTDALNGR